MNKGRFCYFLTQPTTRMRYSNLLLTFLLIVIIDNRKCKASIPVCITNCVQCKQMYGKYFQGRACGDACISSNGRLTPDCNNPITLGNFLKRYY